MLLFRHTDCLILDKNVSQNATAKYQLILLKWMFPFECHKFHPDFPSFPGKNFVRDVQDYENAKFLLFHVQIMSRKWEKFYRSNFV